MFTGFASENTPAIQVWDFFRPFASTSANRAVALADDCAPIQFFRTGATSLELQVYLPTAPIEGKQIKIINCRYGSTVQRIVILSSDARGNGTNSILLYLGPGQTIDFCYSKNCISFGPSNGTIATGWISLNQTFAGSPSSYSVVSGGNNCAASGSGSFVAAGDTNLASGGQSFIGGGSSNTASGIYASIIGGESNNATDNYAAIINGYSNSASNIAAGVFCGNTNTSSSSNTVVLGGSNNTASAPNASVLGGFLNTANGDHGAVIGGRGGTNRGIVGAVTNAASIIPVANGAGFSQTNLLILGRATTSATATVLTSDSNAAGTTNQVILPNNSAYFFRGEVIAGKTAAGDAKGWTVEGVIKRGANAASTALVGTPTVTSLYADAGATTWSITATADTTNGGLAITVTGQAATTIRWVAQIRTTEMTF
jgi:hypothetical protein